MFQIAVDLVKKNLKKTGDIVMRVLYQKKELYCISHLEHEMRNYSWSEMTYYRWSGWKLGSISSKYWKSGCTGLHWRFFAMRTLNIKSQQIWLEMWGRNVQNTAMLEYRCVGYIPNCVSIWAIFNTKPLFRYQFFYNCFFI